MSYIKIKRNGVFEEYDSSNTLKRIIPKNKLETYLSAKVRLEDKITLEELLKAWPRVYDFIPWDFKEHLIEMEKPAKEDKEIEYLQIDQLLCIDKREPKINIVDCYPRFHGVGPVKGETIYYAIEFTPLNELKNLPVSIQHANPAYITKGKAGDSRSWENDVVIPDKDDYNFNPSLLDLYNEIVYELTWFGSPSIRDAKMKDIKKSVEDIEDIKEELKDDESEDNGKTS